MKSLESIEIICKPGIVKDTEINVLAALPLPTVQEHTGFGSLGADKGSFKSPLLNEYKYWF